MDPEMLREMADHTDLRTAPAIEDALAMIAGAEDNDAIFITGSLFLVAEARAVMMVSKR
jgi:folylpolyglutamate synthase/dihydropteroate synthase